MDQTGTTSYVAHLESLTGDNEAIEKQKKRFDDVARKISAKIDALLTPATAPAIIWQLAMKDLHRHNGTVDYKISDFSGHARHIRALVAAKQFTASEPIGDTRVDELLQQCELLWKVLADKQFIENLKLFDARQPGDEESRSVALTMSLLDAMQQEVTYYEYIRDHILAIYSGFSKEIVKPAAKVGVTDIVKAFDSILDTLIPQRMETAAKLTSPLYEKHEEFKRVAASFRTDNEMKAWIENDPDRDKIAKDYEEGFNKFNALFVFEHTDFEDVIGDYAGPFLEFFSFTPGSVNQDYRHPLDNDIVRSCPFAKLENGKFLLMDVYRGCFAPIYKFAELFQSEKLKQRLNKRRDKQLEMDASSYVGQVIAPEKKLESYYIPYGEPGKYAERDLALLRDGILFLVESKAKPMRSVGAHNANLRKIGDDVKSTIKAGYEQACSVIKYIEQCKDSVEFFDRSGNVTITFEKSEIKRTYPIVFLDSYYGMFATDLTLWLNPDDVVGYPWVVDRDTFRAISLRIDDAKKLQEFLAWRTTTQGRFAGADEATIAGYFVQHGPIPFPSRLQQVQLDEGYAKVFDAEYFRRNGLDVADPIADELPTFSSMRRDGDQLVYEIDGKQFDRLNIHTGISHRDNLTAGRKLRRKRRKQLANRKKNL